MSDSHEKNLRTQVPLLQEGGDVLIHAGDITSMGSMKKLPNLARQVGDLPFKYKLFVPGNHDRCFVGERVDEALDILDAAGVLYLEDQGIRIEGRFFYGMPWLQPMPTSIAWEFRCFNAYPDTRAKVDLIPTDTDVLITHGPPAGVLSPNGIGDPALTSQVLYRIHPRLHVFGHDHRGHGTADICVDIEYPTEVTTFVNAALVDDFHRLVYEPVVVDL